MWHTVTRPFPKVRLDLQLVLWYSSHLLQKLFFRSETFSRLFLQVYFMALLLSNKVLHQPAILFFSLLFLVTAYFNVTHPPYYAPTPHSSFIVLTFMLILISHPDNEWLTSQFSFHHSYRVYQV